MTIGSVVKAFKVIETLSSNGEMGVTELSQNTGWDKSTIYRLLVTMKELGYLRQNPDNQRYNLTTKFMNLAGTQLNHQRLVETARPFIERLSKDATEAVKLAVLDGPLITYIDCIESQHLIKVNVEVGKQFPAHSTAVGKAMLAYTEEKTVCGLYPDGRLERRTEKTVGDVEKLLVEMAAIRSRGYAIDNEECSQGLFCVAAPIFDSLGKPAGGISIGFPKVRHNDTESRMRFAQLVMKTCHELSKGLGYRV